MDPSKPAGLSKFAKALILLAVIAVIALFAMIRSVADMVGHVAGGWIPEKHAHLTMLRIEGPIFESEDMLSILSRIGKDRECKGLLLRVDSPGGAVGSSQEIYAALKRLREHGLPLVVSCGNVAASGAYYIALAGDKIFANPGTLTGSIGVIFQFPEAQKLLDKLGLSLQTVKSGALKDVGNPDRIPTAAELAYLQNVINDTYAQFLQDVAENRHLQLNVLRPIADGRVLTGRQALRAGLIDTLGGLDAAKRYLEHTAGVSADIAWDEEPKPKSRLERFLDSDAKSEIGQWVTGLGQELKPGAFFLWR